MAYDNFIVMYFDKDWVDYSIKDTLQNTNNRKYPLRGYILVRERQGPKGSPIRHMEQLLLVTSCDSPAGIGADSDR